MLRKYLTILQLRLGRSILTRVSYLFTTKVKAVVNSNLEVLVVN